MKERVALRFMRDPRFDEVMCNGAEILVRRYACNDFVCLGKIIEVYEKMIEGDAKNFVPNR